VQVCRIEESAVVVKAMDQGRIVVSEEDKGRLAKWRHSCMAYERCIGFYLDGNIDRLIPA
jgi:hypothetical protein